MASRNSNYSRERFLKLVRLAESPYRAEAESAFQMALDELAKGDRRFIEEVIGASEEDQRQKAEQEFARIRADLENTYAQRSTMAKRQLEVKVSDLLKENDSLREVIDRLHWHMNGDESEAAEIPETEPSSHDFGLNFGAYDNAEEGNVVPASFAPMPFFVAMGWLLLLFFFPLLGLFRLIHGRLPNDDDWRLVPTMFSIWLPACAVAAWLIGAKYHFARTSVGQFCSEHFATRKALVIGLYVACTALFGIYMASFPKSRDYNAPEPSGYTFMWLDFFLFGSFVIFIVRRDVRK